jgi:hypothetical protein
LRPAGPVRSGGTRFDEFFGRDVTQPLVALTLDKTEKTYEKPQDGTKASHNFLRLRVASWMVFISYKRAPPAAPAAATDSILLARLTARKPALQNLSLHILKRKTTPNPLIRTSRK